MTPKNPVRNQFARKLRAAREAKGFASAQQFATFIGIEPHTYRAYEAARSEPPFLILLHICRTLNVTPNDLLFASTGHADFSKARESVKSQSH